MVMSGLFITRSYATKGWGGGGLWHSSNKQQWITTFQHQRLITEMQVTAGHFVKNFSKGEGGTNCPHGSAYEGDC